MFDFKSVCMIAIFAMSISNGNLFAADWFGGAFPGTASGTHEYSIESSEPLTVKLTTNGGDIWGTGDAGMFYLTPQRGDFEVLATIPAQISSDENPINATYAKCGVMIRPADAQGAPNLMFGRDTTKYTTSTETDENGESVTVTSATTCQARMCRRPSWNAGTSDAQTSTSAFPAEGDVRVRLVRRGNRIDGYYSTNENFTVWYPFSGYTFADGTLPNALLAGVAFSPNNGANVGSLTFKDIVCRPLIETVVSGDEIAVSWCATGAWTNEVVSYQVERRTVDGDWLTLAEGEINTALTDAQTEIGVSYIYRVTALLSDGMAKELGVSSPVRRATENLVQYAFPAKPDGQKGEGGVALRMTKDGSVTGSLAYWTSLYVSGKWPTSVGVATESIRVYPLNASSGLEETTVQNIEVDGRTQFLANSTGYYFFRVAGDDNITLSINGEIVFSRSDWRAAIAPYWMEKGKLYFLQFTYQNGNDTSSSLQIRYTNMNAGNSVNDSNWPYLGPAGRAKLIPYPWEVRELGDAEVYGHVAFNNDTRVFTLTGSGRGIGGTYDEAEYVVQDLTEDDVLIYAKVTPSTTGDVGLVLRGGLDGAAAVQAALVVNGTTATFVTRTTADVAADKIETELSATSYELALRSESNVVSAFVRPDGGAWQQVGSGVTIEGLAKFGFVASAGSRTAYATSTVADFSILPVQAAPKFALTQVNENTVSVTLNGGDTAAADRIAEGQSRVAYAWYDGYSILPTHYKIQVMEGAPEDGAGDVYAESFGAGDSFTYSFDDADPRKAAVFTATPLDDFSGSTTPVVSLAAREEPSETGTGLYEANYNSSYAGPRSSAPNHASIGGIPAYWSAPVDGILKHSDGTSIEKDNSFVFWIGSFTPPYTSWYRFRSRTCNAFAYLTLNGTNYVTDLTRSIDSSNGAVIETNVTDWVYLKGGVPLDISYSTRMCNGEANTGLGLDVQIGGESALFTEIPLTALSTSRMGDSPVIHSEGSAFGEWRTHNWGDETIGLSGNAIVDGVVRDETKGFGFDEFNVTLLSEGRRKEAFNENQTSETGGHFIYRTMTGNFEFSCELSIPFFGDDDATWGKPWRRQGIMVRQSLDANAPFAGIFRFKRDGYLDTLVRSTAGGGIADLEKNNRVAYGDTMTFVRIVRRSNQLRLYHGDKLATTFSLDGWGDTVYLGFAGACYKTDSNFHQTVSHFQNVRVGCPKPLGMCIIIR